MIQSKGGVSRFLKIFLLIFFGFFSYSCLYLDIAFLMHSWVYFVMILRTFMFAVLAILATVFIHSRCRSVNMYTIYMCTYFVFHGDSFI